MRQFWEQFMKIVLIGAGSYVFAPAVLRDAIIKHQMTGELALVDLNLQAAETSSRGFADE